MDKKAIVAAISDPVLVRRAFTALRSDPGPLESASEGTAMHMGQEMTYRIYHNGQNYILASECGSLGPFAAVVASVLRLSKHIGQAGLLGNEYSVSCLAIVSSDRMTNYCLSSYPITAETLRPDGSLISNKIKGTTGWFSLVLGPGIEDMEEVVQDMEVRLHGN